MEQMENLFVGPEAIQEVLSSMFGVPFVAKFRFRNIDNIQVRKAQRIFFALPTIEDPLTGLQDTLRKIPKRFCKFEELYRVVYDQKAVAKLLDSDKPTALEDIYFTGVNIYLFDEEDNSWQYITHQELTDKKLYKEETQMSHIQKLFRVLFPSYPPVAH